MPFDKSILFDFLKALDDELKERIILVAVGGTAMTLLDLKPTTIDIDFTIPNEYKTTFDKALANVRHGFKLDMWTDGFVFCQVLPDDYLKKSIEITEFK